MSVVETETNGAVARIWLNRPEVHNAQNEEMLAALDKAFDEAAAAPDINVIVLAGRGRSFSSGHDLKRTVEGAAEPEVAKLRRTSEGRLEHETLSYWDPCLKIRNCPKPTIAEVRGHCIAAGLMVAAMCDLLVASETAKFSNPVVRMGAVATEILFEPWELGVRKAKELLFTGDTFSAEEARQLGLANRVVADDALTAEVDQLAQRIAANPPVAMRLMKQSLNETLEAMGQMQSWRYHFMVHQLGHSTQEYQEIIGAPMDLKSFVARRDGAHQAA
jgi:enoyl-CoA hydratase